MRVDDLLRLELRDMRNKLNAINEEIIRLKCEMAAFRQRMMARLERVRNE